MRKQSVKSNQAQAPELAWPLRPMTKWSWMVMPSATAAVSISLVISMSSREGLGSPLGGLCIIQALPWDREITDVAVVKGADGDVIESVRRLSSVQVMYVTSTTTAGHTRCTLDPKAARLKASAARCQHLSGRRWQLALR
jgi:hypothetical protein